VDCLSDETKKINFISSINEIGNFPFIESRFLIDLVEKALKDE